MPQCRICLSDHSGDYESLLCEDCSIAGMHLFMQEALCASPMPNGENPGVAFTSLIGPQMSAIILHMRERLLRCRAKQVMGVHPEDCPECGH